MKPLRVLSLFDGISCGQVALERANIPVEIYYASEIDKHAIQITQKNYPNTIQLGDVTKIDFTQFIGKIDLIMGGSPCQNLSIVNKKSRDGLDGDKSKLFFKFVEALEVIKPKYFLLENVASMKKDDKNKISEILGVEPVLINSALVSAQTRNRLYWTNIVKIEQPEDKGILLKDVLEKYVDEKYYISEKMKGYIFACPSNFTNNYKINCEKARPLVTKHDKRANTTNYCSDDFINGGDKNRIRRLSPLECERLQTLPDGYTELGMSCHYYNIYNIINMVIKGEQLCKNVKLKDVKTLSQTEKQGYAINIIYDISDMEQQNLQEILLNEKKSVLLMDVITSDKQERDIVLNTIKDLKEQEQQNLIKMSLKNVNIAIDWQLQEECVIGTIKIGYDTETQNIQIKLEKEQITTDIKNLKENIEYNIEKLLQKYWEEIYHLKKLYTILIWINLIMIKKIYMYVIKMNTQAYISNLIELQGNSLKLELSNLKMADIIPISSTQRYKAIGNGWTVDVIAHIFGYLEEGKENDTSYR